MSTWLAPAKLNLFLHVVGRRPDGYHLLQTVFQFIDVYDELGFEPRDDSRVQRLSANNGIDENSDLIILAARLLQEKTGCRKGANISIQKKIPTGAGLGGGSSDAATTLLALNRIWNLGLCRQKLAEIGLQLGADVPVFVHGHNAWAQGIGEMLEAIELKKAFFAVIVPSVHVPTAEIFKHLDLTEYPKLITIRDFKEGRGTNHLEPVTCKLYPQVRHALDWLSARALAGERARMTGTGAGVFMQTQTLQQAKDMVESCPDYWQAFVARGLLKHPHG